MAYKICYDSVPVKPLAHQKTVARRKIYWRLLFAAGIGATALLPQLRRLFQQMIFPGSDAQTLEALETLARDLGAGEPLGKALDAFCRQVIAFAGG